jgi:hypothetical protein
MMCATYKVLGNRVTVELLFNEEELDVEAFVTMMVVDSLELTPLYLQIILVHFSFHSAFPTTKTHSVYRSSLKN